MSSKQFDRESKAYPPPQPISVILDILKADALLIDTYNINDGLLVDYPQTDTRKLNGIKNYGNNVISSFICIRGYETDGHNYIQQAVSTGVGLIISEIKAEIPDLPNIIVKDSRRALALLAKTYFNNPSCEFSLIGVTGTNGKTSIVKIIESILLTRNKKVATIGTLGYSVNGKEYPLDRTTPDITELNTILRFFAESNVEYVIMEVSSHALSLDRVFGLEFDYALFTNLSREHLDFHTDMEDYFGSKSLLFSYLEENKGTALINIDDKYGERLYSSFKGSKVALRSCDSGAIKKELCEKAILENVADHICYRIIRQDLRQTDILLSGRYNDSTVEESTISTKLIGKHNAFNVSAALALTTLALLPDNESSIKNGIQLLASGLPEKISGRLELVKQDCNIHCFIDYAHTPAALESVCKTLKDISINSTPPEMLVNEGGLVTETASEHNDDKTFSEQLCPYSFLQTRLICVYGAGGDRDKGKRKEMTDAVMKYADVAIITNDNPRTENPLEIISDLVQDIHPLTPYLIMPDRKKAIAAAINMASDGDTVLIAGKGHETYQIFGKDKTFFSDYEEACNELSKKTDASSELFDVHAKSSHPTVTLAIPLDISNIRLLLGYCSKTDLGINRSESRTTRICRQKMAPLRKSLLADYKESANLIKHITTDTRYLRDCSLFIALQGDNFDGHNYIDKVLENETNFVVINRNRLSDLPDNIDKSRVITVEDTLIAPALIAKKYKYYFRNTTVGVTGSTGKTSVKEICYNIFSQAGTTLKNVSNENNIIGVSRTLLNLNSTYRYVIMELGTNTNGEMQVLADTTEPDIGMIINIGSSHLEAFKDHSGVYREKISLLTRNMPIRIIPQDENKYLFSDFPLPAVRLGLASHFDSSSPVDNDRAVEQFAIINDNGVKKEYLMALPESYNYQTALNNYQFHLPSKINYLSDNAAFAVTASLLAGIDRDIIKAGLDQKLDIKNRMQIIRYSGSVVIADCYNANPTSMKSAIEYWAENYQELTHTAVIGDMLELGEQSLSLHKEMGRYLDSLLADKPYQAVIFTVGKHSSCIKSETHFDNVEGLLRSDAARKQLQGSDSVLLIKGSHGIHLEKLVEIYRQEQTANGNDRVISSNNFSSNE